MAQRYILVCQHCKSRMVIEPAQAGQTIRCRGCKTPHHLGTLREIRALTPEADVRETVEHQPKAREPWSHQRRALFVAGLLALVAGGVLGGIQLYRAGRIDTARPNVLLTDRQREEIGRLSPSEMLARWSEIDASAVATWNKHPYLENRDLARRRRIWGWLSIAIAAAGLVSIFTAFVIKNPPAAEPDRRG
jgi:hypothetical protein